MNFDNLQTIWNSPENRAENQHLKWMAEMKSKLKKRRMFQAAWLIWTFFLLTCTLVIAFRALQKGEANLEQNWFLLPMLFLPWAITFHFLRMFLRERSAIKSGLSVAETIDLALTANQSERSRLKLVALLWTIMVPLIGMAITQLRADGKLATSEFYSMAAFFCAILFFSGLIIAAKYFGRVIPESRRLLEIQQSISERR
jgi:hypothetical protein